MNPGNPKRPAPGREPSRMGNLLTVVLVVTTVFLILSQFAVESPQGRTYPRLRRLAYQGDVESLHVIGNSRLDAEVLFQGKAEKWEDVRVPEYAVVELPELERLVGRNVRRVSLDELMRELTAGNWQVLGGYTLPEPPQGETGLYLEYRRGGQTYWARITGDRFSNQISSLIEDLTGRGVAITSAPVAQEEKVSYEPATDLWSGLLITMLPWLLIMAFFLFIFSRQMRSAGGSGGIMSFGRSRARQISPEQAKVTFDQVAGVEEAKEEVHEIIAFLKDPKRFSRLGGRVPRGVLLVGAPGTGKTLLAKAIAGEAEVPFFAISGSDFVEMFVGVGASRVRDLFKQARETAPCVIFLDEIDAVGRKRGTGLGGGHDEREQTLNAILVEMDGFETDTGVIMIAATNRPDVLDPALLRPGRFDRQITLDLPDLRGREAILVVHAQRVKMGPDVDLSLIARGTPMFSGAELEATVNEAALVATLKDKKYVEHEDLEEARDKVRFGRQKKSRVMEEEDRRLTAYHEAGHALVATHLKDVVEPLHKVTIIPRGMALGSTMQLPEKDKYHHRRKELLGTLKVLYGGRVAEELFCDDISGGAANDIQRATELVRYMVCAWGMSDTLGPVSLGEQRSEVFLGDELLRSRNYSEDTSRAIDVEVRRILGECYDSAREILDQQRDEMERLAEALLRFETLTGEEVEAIQGGATADTLRPAPPEPEKETTAGKSAGGSRVPEASGKKPEEGLDGGPVPAPEPA